MRIQALLTLCILAAAALAGCADSGGEDTADADDDAHDHADHDHNGTVDPGLNGTLLGNATLEADVLNGTAPLVVNFTLDVEGADENTTWSLDFGDGNATNGTGLPAQASHTYNVTGNLTALLQAGSGNTTRNATLTIAIAAGVADEVPAPEKLHWEFGETLGCMEDLESTCQTYDSGPGSSGPDGHWIELGEAYWGLALTSTVEKGDAAGSGEWPFYDTDCFFTDADGGVMGEGHNGGDQCKTDAIPQGTQWMYLYPYLTPALSMTVDVHLE